MGGRGRQAALAPEGGVAVIVAAHDASATVARAIHSALREPEVAEVVVVDDCSRDDTFDVARSADDGSGRLRVLRQVVNRGPAAARNLAIETTSAPYLAILDADDCFLDGRFRTLLADCDWDLAADNVMFVAHSCASDLLDMSAPSFARAERELEFAEFVEGNISRPGEGRGDLGFLKPVIRRGFLKERGIRYDEGLRLGEDYVLYARCMALGARFRVLNACGYLALVRSDSLSARHETEDLERLMRADTDLAGILGLPSRAKAALARHEKHVRSRFLLRRFLDIKDSRGMRSAIRFAAGSGDATTIARGLAGDKYRTLLRRWFHVAEPTAGPRFLLEPNSAWDLPGWRPSR